MADMTNTTTKTAAEIESMDAGELREHLAAYVAANHLDYYADSLIWEIASAADITTDEVRNALTEDLEAMGVEV